MAIKIITTFFTNFGVPETGLTPTIDIWLLDPTNPNINTLVINDDPLVEIGNGLYRYNFTSYDSTQNYIFSVDGGIGLPINERYSVATNESFVEDISNGVWEEPATLHVNADSMGLHQNQIKADTTSISISLTAATSLLATLLKYQKNRTRIDTITKTLTIYDDNGTTALKIFDLKDSAGNPSVIEVAERNPQ